MENVLKSEINENRRRNRSLSGISRRGDLMIMIACRAGMARGCGFRSIFAQNRLYSGKMERYSEEHESGNDSEQRIS